MGKVVKSESPGHGAVDSTHLYTKHFIHRFKDAGGGLEGSRNS